MPSCGRAAPAHPSVRLEALIRLIHWCGSRHVLVQDLFRDDDVAYGENGTTIHSHNCLRFGAEATAVVKRHAALAVSRRQQAAGASEVSVAPQPLFLLLSMQDPHAPTQTPQRLQDLYSFPNRLRNIWSGMCSCIDEAVANVTYALREHRMWANTLFIFASDNGSPVAGWGAAGSNHPLRGGKATDWEGGVRTPCLVAGGWVPRSRRGKRLNGLVHIADLYATLCSIAGGVGGCPRDRGPADVDSIDMSSFWLRGPPHAPSPRREIVHDLNGYAREGNRSGVIRVGAWKLVAKRDRQATWFGRFSPEAPSNVTAAQAKAQSALKQLKLQQQQRAGGAAAVGTRAERTEWRKRRSAVQAELADLRKAAQRHFAAGLKAEDCSLRLPCLYHIPTDPEERTDLALQEPLRVDRLRKVLASRYDAFHLGPKPFGRKGERPVQTVDRWRKGYCGAAMVHKGLMAPWMAMTDPLLTAGWGVKNGAPAPATLEPATLAAA